MGPPVEWHNIMFFFFCVPDDVIENHCQHINNVIFAIKIENSVLPLFVYGRDRRLKCVYSNISVWINNKFSAKSVIDIIHIQMCCHCFGIYFLYLPIIKMQKAKCIFIFSHSKSSFDCFCNIFYIILNNIFMMKHNPLEFKI